MARATSIEKLTWQDIEQRFGLHESNDDSFFLEWQGDLPEISAFEKERLERIKATYRNMEKLDAVLESSVNMTVAGPLLDTAGLFLPPFHLETEKSVEIFAVDETNTKVRGRLDALIVKDFLWVLTIESKQVGFSLRVGTPQLLAYMMGAPNAQKTVYGMVTNGRSFTFLKLERSPQPVYDRSEEFIIDQHSGLEQTLRILKKISALAIN